MSTPLRVYCLLDAATSHEATVHLPTILQRYHDAVQQGSDAYERFYLFLHGGRLVDMRHYDSRLRLIYLPRHASPERYAFQFIWRQALEEATPFTAFFFDTESIRAPVFLPAMQATLANGADVASHHLVHDPLPRYAVKWWTARSTYLARLPSPPLGAVTDDPARYIHVEFDPVWYASHYPELQSLADTPGALEQHYHAHGKAEGRLPRDPGAPGFDWQWYATRYPDLQGLGPEQLLAHWLTVGKEEGRTAERRVEFDQECELGVDRLWLCRGDGGIFHTV